MSGRELVILLLGLAIVAVVLRGLYVAINARRGQIKLAIDKNIPQDIDLESLELAELPGGGARVVTRSLEEVNRQNSALDLAESKAKSLGLNDSEDDGHIPVLMDAVELSEPAVYRPAPSSELQQEAAAASAEPMHDSAAEYSPAPQDEKIEEQFAEEIEEQFAEEFEEDFMPQAGQDHSIGENWEDDAELEGDYSDESAAGQESLAENGDEPESALLDYGEEVMEDPDDVDAMSSVAPDYEDDNEDESIAAAPAVQAPDDEAYEENEWEEEQHEQAEFEDHELAQQQEEEQEQPAVFDADSSVEEFSMTAGERIGGNPPAIGEENQTGLFDDIEETDVPEKPKGGRSLFSMFGRKSRQRRESREEERLADQVSAESVEDEPGREEPEDILLQSEPVVENAQLDIAEAEYAEPVVVEPVYEEAELEDEIVDELDEKRAASIEQSPEPEEASGGEFEHSEVLVLNVTAKDGRVFSGDDLLHVLITAGLKFGDMNIFHKRLSKEHQGTVIFSVANMLNPGTFDLNNMDEFTTLGISFFLALPSPINNLDAFEQMLGVAQEIRDTLDGDLKDDHRNGMTGQTIEHYRQRVRDFELRRLKAVAARG